jgi:hypothetical protein
MKPRIHLALAWWIPGFITVELGRLRLQGRLGLLGRVARGLRGLQGRLGPLLRGWERLLGPQRRRLGRGWRGSRW